LLLCLSCSFARSLFINISQESSIYQQLILIYIHTSTITTSTIVREQGEKSGWLKFLFFLIIFFLLKTNLFYCTLTKVHRALMFSCVYLCVFMLPVNACNHYQWQRPIYAPCINLGIYNKVLSAQLWTSFGKRCAFFDICICNCCFLLIYQNERDRKMHVFFNFIFIIIFIFI